jgi:RNA polymerase-binding transcription factor DksA
MKKVQKKKKPASKPKRAAVVKKVAAPKSRKKTNPRSAVKPSAKAVSKSAHKPAGRSTARSAAKSSTKKVLCEFCGAEIPPERVEILPDTTTCVQCSQTKPYSEAQILGLNGEDVENRLNVEDFEEADTDFSISSNDQW